MMSQLNGAVRLWSLDASASSQALVGAEKSINSVAFSPTTEEFLSVTSDGDIGFWTFAGSEKPVTPPRHPQTVTAATYSPDGSFIVTGSSDGQVTVRKPDGTPKSTSIKGHDGSITSIAVSYGSDVIVTGGADKTIRLWNRDGSPRNGRILGYDGRITVVTFSPHGDVLVGADEKGRIRFFDFEGSEKGALLHAHEAAVTSLAFAPHKDILVSAGRDDTIRLWNSEGESLVDPVKFPAGRGLAVAFSDDSKLAVASELGVVKLLDFANFKNEKAWVVGMPLRQIGFVKNSLWVVAQPNQIRFSSLDLKHTATVIISDDGALAFSQDGYYAGEGELARTVRLFDSAAQPLSEADAKARFSEHEVTVGVTNERKLLWTAWQGFVAMVSKVKALYDGLPLSVRVASWPIALFVSILAFVISVWVVSPHKLAQWAMPDIAGSPAPPWKLWGQILSLVTWLGNTQRSLDAWLLKNETVILESHFNNRPSVAARQRYVDLGNEQDVDKWQRSLSEGNPRTCWISGPGGCGKSTLAFAMARQLRDRTTSHPVLPVLIDDDWTSEITDAMATLVRANSKQPTDHMVKKLGHTGRLLLIVDGLSELRNEEAAQEIGRSVRSGFVRYLLVTSREADAVPLLEPVNRISVGPLGSERMGQFVRTYLEDDEDVDKIVATLEGLTDGRAISPLFARLAIGQLEHGRDIPNNYPDLVHEFVRALRPKGRDSLREDDFLRACYVAAHSCVEKEVTPGWLDVMQLRGVLAGTAIDVAFRSEGDAEEVRPEIVLDQLVQCGLLELDVARVRVRFAHDPIAEYLAAWHAVRQPTRKTIGSLRRKIAMRQKRNPSVGESLAEALDSLESRVDS